MSSSIVKRVLEESEYILRTNDTVRDMAKVFNVSKSTIHKDLHERLNKIDKELYQKVRKILQYHLDVRHIRGGEQTRKKYLKIGEKYHESML